MMQPIDFNGKNNRTNRKVTQLILKTPQLLC